MKNKLEVTEEELNKIYAHFEKTSGYVPRHIKLLAKYNPEALKGFYYLRKSTMYDPPEGKFSKKNKEIIITAVECASKISGEAHARYAIRAGASLEELTEALSIILWLDGITTFAHYCVPAILAAEDELGKISNKDNK